MLTRRKYFSVGGLMDCEGVTSMPRKRKKEKNNKKGETHNDLRT